LFSRRLGIRGDHPASGQDDDGEAARRLEAILERALEEEVVDDAALAASLAQSQDFWRIRDLMSEVQREEGGSIKHDVSVPVAAIPEFLERAGRTVTEMIPGSRPVPFGHYGDGNIHDNLSQPPEMDKAEFIARWDEVNAAVHAIVAELGGSISAEHGIGRMKRHLLASVKSDVEMEMMRAIKQTFDPKGILNPGKVV
jgi:FAD/FMN-containing dehydrogenase